MGLRTGINVGARGVPVVDRLLAGYLANHPNLEVS